MIVSDPQAIVDRYRLVTDFDGTQDPPYGPEDVVCCNMPPEFRPHYPDSGLVGFGACFHRDAPQRAFKHFADSWFTEELALGDPMFLRRCDNVFTVLTPRVLVDVPKTDREMASDPNRMWKQPWHTAERDRMIELARKVRDAT